MSIGVSSPLVDYVVLQACASQNIRLWTPQEENFLRTNLHRMTWEQLGLQLGRSPNAVKIRQVRAQIPAASKRPGFYTGNQVARILGTDIHSIVLLHKRGILRFQVLPGKRQILQIKRVALWTWAVSPKNWIYFRIDQVRHPQLRRLCQLRRERWDDEWWTPGMVADFHGLASTTVINHAIHDGRLLAKRWGNWWIKRSDALTFRTWKGKGGKGYERENWTPAGDAFLIKARNELRLQWETIGRLMKWNPKRAMYRYKILKNWNKSQPR